MEQPIIILWPFHKSSKWYRTLVSKLICFFTNSNYTHAAIFLNGHQYESTVMNKQHGTLKTEGMPPASRNCITLRFKEGLSEKRLALLEWSVNQQVVQKRPYNFMKIAALALVYPTRWFWNLINWVPFQNEVYGSVCSVFVDASFKDAGVDLLPGENEEYTAPGDFLKSPLLTRI